MTCPHTDIKPISSACDWCRQCGSIRFRAQGTWYAPGGKEDAERKSSDNVGGLTTEPGAVKAAPEILTLDTFEPDDCCGKHLAKALRDGKLKRQTMWECPTCGCDWFTEAVEGVRHWKPMTTIQLLRG